MRTLRFIVDDQIIRPDPSSDFDGLVPGSEGHVKAMFSFSPEWQKLVRVIAFYSPLGAEYPPQYLRDGKTCIIPAEALSKQSFKIQAIGKGPNLKIVTNKLTVNQKGGKT